MNTNYTMPTTLFNKATQALDQQMSDHWAIQEQEVLVAIDYATICTRELQAFWTQPLPQTPRLIGKELIGRVIKLGSQVTADGAGQPLRQGDRLLCSRSSFHQQTVKVAHLEESQPYLYSSK